MALLIGLTGGIATGKSTVAGMFINENIPVIDTDKISNDLLLKGREAYNEVIALFSDSVLLTNAEINRKKLGKAIFNDSVKRQQLNEIIHPRVKSIVISEIQKHIELGAKVIVIDVPLLFETDFHKVVDKTIVVYTPYDKQIRRLIERDSIKEDYAKAKINTQLPIEEKVKLADYVIDNSASILRTKKDFNKVLKELEVL